MPRLQIPRPNPKQMEFFNARAKYICFGGARAGGKSWGVRIKAILLAFQYPGILIYIIRKSYPELRANHIRPMTKILRCGQPDALANYNDSKKEIIFPNGSVITFKYLETERDMLRFQGTEADVFFLDEATQYAEEFWEILKPCLRAVNEYPKRIYLTCNPGGQGHAWVRRLWLDRQYKPNENPDDYVFIQSLPTDNIALMKAQPDYLEQLQSLPPKLREAWLYGNWDIYEGQFFEEFRTEPDLAAAEAAGCRESPESLRQQHRWVHVIEPFEPKPEWKIYRSFDWGYSHPFSCAWWAVDYDGVLYRILELYGCRETPNEGVKWIPEQVFREIHRIETEHPWLRGKHINGVADPAIWDAERGVSIAETAGRNGVYFDPGDNKRIPGWMQMHYRLAFDENGFAMMYIFSTCKGFIRTVPTLVYDDHRPEDLDTDGEDHIADETRYLCMARPIKPRMPVPVNQFNESAMHVYLDLEEKDLMPARAIPRMERINAD